MTFFYHTRTKNPKIYIEPQKTSNYQSNLEKNKAVSFSLTSDYTAKLQ